jgi:putative ABC transport system ATP-binding protein
MSVLELRRVSKVYGEGPAEVQALRGVDLSVDAGELVAVMGPSGSGKSTLLTIAGSLEDPTNGEVLVGGVALSGMSRNERARLRRRSIGYVFQDFNLLAGLTTAENVALPLELDGVVGDRRLLLADEPSGALDSVNAEAVMRLVRVACRQGMAGVVVTHDAQLAFVGRSRGVPARRASDRPDHAATGPRVPPRAGAEPMSASVPASGRPRWEPGTVAFPLAKRWSAGRGGCSAGSGASSCWYWRCLPSRSRRRSSARRSPPTRRHRRTPRRSGPPTISSPCPAPIRGAADIAAIKQGFGTIDVIGNEKLATGSVQSVDLSARTLHRSDLARI